MAVTDRDIASGNAATQVWLVLAALVAAWRAVPAPSTNLDHQSPNHRDVNTPSTAPMSTPIAIPYVIIGVPCIAEIADRKHELMQPVRPEGVDQQLPSRIQGQTLGRLGAPQSQ